MSRIETRHRQGWVGHVTDSIPEAFSLAHEAMDGKKPISIAYHGNIVDLLEYAVNQNIHIDLLSDKLPAMPFTKADTVRRELLSPNVQVCCMKTRRNSVDW